MGRKSTTEMDIMFLFSFHKVQPGGHIDILMNKATECPDTHILQSSPAVVDGRLIFML